jgi:formamidopyrimidine-DNA glycosylase
MPELPEVETVRRGLAPHLVGQRLARVITRRADLRQPIPPDFAQVLTGRAVEALDRRAKYLVMRMAGGAVALIHLGMSGRFTVFEAEREAPLGAHDHVVFETGAGARLVYTDPRRFGLMVLGEAATLNAHPLLRAMGPEPLSDAFNGTALAAALKGRRTPIKAALLDQRVVAGLGNIYVCEALYRARLSPRRSAHTVQGGRAERLAAAIKAVLEDAIAAGGSSLRDYAQATGELGYFQHAFDVYGREGEPCRTPGCAGTVRRLVQAGRSSFFCPACQR